MDGKLPTPTFNRLLSHNSKRRLQYQVSEAITPFVSSTFIDFEDEREYLVKKIFPQLNLLCAEKGSRFEALDLRWGISEAQKDKGHLIQSCLDYVRHCSPYFICLLGERYGSHRDPKSDLLSRDLQGLGDNPNWLDKNLVVAAVTGNYSFILNNSDNHFASITELEISYRLTLQNHDKMFFYLRTPIDFDQFEDENVRKSKKEKFGSESEYAASRLKNLKRKIRSYVPDSQVREYTTVEELGQLVFDDWSNLITNEFFDVSTSLRGVAMEMYQEWQAHAAYQQSLGDESRYYTTLNSTLAIEIDQYIDDLYLKVSQGFPKTETMDLYKDCLSLLNKSTLSNYKHEKGLILTVRGPRGSGKSAFLAYLSKKRSDLPKTFQSAGVKVFFHFVGCNSQSEDLANFMTRYIDEMTEYFLDIIPPRDERKCLIDSFHAAMCFGPSVIFLDGMDQFASSPQFPLKEVKDCKWLPEVLPPGCLLILSTTPHDQSHRALSPPMKKDVNFFELVTPQTSLHKNEILSCHCGPRKKLEERQKNLIISCQLSSSPFFLAALARELQLCGGYMSVDCQVGKYVACSNLRTLWHLVMLRWANDYGWSPITQSIHKKVSQDVKEEKWTVKSNWVIDILRLLSVSRNGLSQEDLLQCLKSLGYRGDSHSVGTFDFMQFRASSQQAVLCRRNGLLYIKHNVVKEAVLYFFLNGVCPEMTTVSTQNLTNQPAGSGRWISSRLKFQNVIADYLLAQPSQLWKDRPYLLEELLWQLRNTGNLSKLVTVLTSPAIFTVIMNSVDKCGAHLLADVRNYWQYALCPIYDVGREYLQMVDNVEKKTFESSSHVTANVKLTQDPPDVRSYHTTPVNVDDVAKLPFADDASVTNDDTKGDQTENVTNSGEKRAKPVILIVENAVDHQQDEDISLVNSASSTVSPQSPSNSNIVSMPSKHEEVSMLLTLVGKFLQLLQRNSEAETVYKQALDHQSTATDYSADINSQLKYIECVLAIGIACARQNQPIKLKEATDWLNKALETVQLLITVCIGETIVSTLSFYQGKILVELIEIYMKQGRIDDAKSHLEMVESENLLPYTDNTYCRMCFYKATLLHKRLLFEESEREFEKVLRMYTDRYGPNHENLADVLIAYGDLLSDKNNFDGFNYFTAEDYYQRALSLKQKHQPHNSLEIAHIKEKLARHMLTNQKLNSSQLVAYQHLLDAIDIKKIVQGPEQRHTAVMQHYLNENFKALRKSQHKTESGGAQADTFLDGELTIPPVATSNDGHGKCTTSTRTHPKDPSHRSVTSQGSIQLRPASALSWNDRDLIYLQQRKKKSERKLVKVRRDRINNSGGVEGSNPILERGLSASFSELPKIVSRPTTSQTSNYHQKTHSSRSRSSEQSSSDHMIQHRSTCEIPGQFDVSVSNCRSVHGPNSTLKSLASGRHRPRSLITSQVPGISRVPSNVGMRNRLYAMSDNRKSAIACLPSRNQEGDECDNDALEEHEAANGGYGDGVYEQQFINGAMFVPARFGTY